MIGWLIYFCVTLPNSQHVAIEHGHGTRATRGGSRIVFRCNFLTRNHRICRAAASSQSAPATGRLCQIRDRRLAGALQERAGRGARQYAGRQFTDRCWGHVGPRAVLRQAIVARRRRVLCILPSASQRFLRSQPIQHGDQRATDGAPLDGARRTGTTTSMALRFGTNAPARSRNRH